MISTKKGFLISKIVIVIVFLLLVVFLGVYKFPNQDVTIVIETDKEKINYEITASEIEKFYDIDYKEDYSDSTITELSVPCSNADINSISQVCFYRQFKSICVDKITSNDIPYYVASNENGYTFNMSVCNTVKEISESYVMERIIYAEIILICALFLLILTNAANERIDSKSRNNHGPIYEIKRFIGELYKYREYIFYSAKADLNAEVANSYLNRLWWVLEPFFNMLVYVIVFGRIMGSSIQNYSTYVFSALLMWNYFNHILNYSVKCIRTNRDIVTKIYMPKYVLLLSNMVLNFIKLLFSMAVLVVMMIIFRVNIGWCIFWTIPTYIIMILLSFSFGLLLMHYGVFVDDLAYAVNILLTMIMFLSGLFYDVIVTLPKPLNGVMLSANPVSLFLDTMRTAVFNNTLSNVPLVIIWFILGILIMYIGLHTVYKNENGYVKVI